MDPEHLKLDPQSNPLLAPGLQALNMSKRFGSLVALDNVSMTIHPGTFHAILGGNGAGKSTLVKCIMGYYQPDAGEIIVGQRLEIIKNPKEALALGIGMVYQHFTLVGNMTVGENLVLSRGTIPFTINWEKEKAELRKFLQTTPFFIPLDSPVNALAAGQKQKLEIVKQLYLKNKLLFLDEPTSVLTPQEADEVLTMLRDMTKAGDLSVAIITHKFSHVMKFADDFTVLRTGKLVGHGKVSEYTPAQMAEMMIGNQSTATMAARTNGQAHVPQLVMKDLSANDDTGVEAFEKLNLQVHSGEIVGIVGVSGNGQSELVQTLAGQRQSTGGTILVKGKRYRATRREISEHKVYCLPEEPLRNACVGPMSVGANMSFREFDRHPFTLGKLFVNPRHVRRFAGDLIKRYRVKTPSHETPIRNLSGGNVQRAVLARELSGTVNVLIAQNPCFGLDFAAVADIRSQIMDARNRGAAVLLVTEDLDEAFELSDRIVVMFDGKFVYECTIADADIATIGRHMAGHGNEEHGPGGNGGCSLMQVDALPFAYEFDPRHAALIVIDMQRDFVQHGGFGEALGNNVDRLTPIIQPLAALMSACRRHGVAVIHTREGHKPDLSDCPPAKRSRGNSTLRIGDKGPMGRILIQGEYGHAIIPELAPLAGEIVIDKPGKGSFYGTDLQERLESRGITHLFFTGVTTEVCVQTSMREANDRGYECLLVEDCTESYFPEFKQATLAMVRAQGAIVGWTSPSKTLIAALSKG